MPCPACTAELRLIRRSPARWKCPSCRTRYDMAPAPTPHHLNREDGLRKRDLIARMTEHLPMRTEEVAHRLAMNVASVLRHVHLMPGHHAWDGRVFKGSKTEWGHD